MLADQSQSEEARSVAVLQVLAVKDSQLVQLAQHAERTAQRLAVVQSRLSNVVQVRYQLCLD